MEVGGRVIPSRRGRLLIQSIVVTALAVGIGTFLQSWSVLRSSPLGTLGDVLGFPVITVVVTGLGLWFATARVQDSWTHHVVLGSTSLTIRDHLGTYTVPCSGITSAQTIPLGGVVIAFRDREQWLGQSADAIGLRRQTSDVLRCTYGADVLISKNQLAMDAAEFVALLQQRMPAIKGEGVQQGP